MKSIIDSIYAGEIRPSEDILTQSEELRSLYSQAAEKLEIIRNQLPENQRALLDEYTALKNRICEESAKTGFRMGLSMGVKLTSESFYYGKKLTAEKESDDE